MFSWFLAIDGWDYLIWKINVPIVDGLMMIEVLLLFMYVFIMDGRD